MKLTNCLKKKEESKIKCKIVFKKYIYANMSLENVSRQPENYKFVDIIAKVFDNEYIFEAYYELGEKGTDYAHHYLGTWGGVEK